MRKFILAGTLAVSILTACGNSKSKPTVDSIGVKSLSSGKYQCPMKCEGEKTYAATGTCSMCKMDLKEVK